MQDKQFDEAEMRLKEMHGCHLRGFLGNHKAANYQDVVQDLLTLYKAMGCNMGLKIQSYGMQYGSENPLSGVTLGFFPRKFWQSL
jgi:hypothetical protein